MQELLQLIIGIIFLILGFFAGNLLRDKTKEEQKKGKIWFKILTAIDKKRLGSFYLLFYCNCFKQKLDT